MNLEDRGEAILSVHSVVASYAAVDAAGVQVQLLGKLSVGIMLRVHLPEHCF